MKTCSFFGHSKVEVTLELQDKLKAQVLRLLSNGFDCFYFGGFGAFDKLCWHIVTKIKCANPHIQRIFCLSDPKHLLPSKRPKYLKDSDYEQFVYLNLDFDYWYSRIYYRNCKMISQSDFAIFYAFNRENSGAYKAYKYALKIKKRCINLANE